MSRSKRRTPIFGITTADSEKNDKRKANRKFRRIVREQVKKGSEQFSELREVSNVWSFGKDGKRYFRKCADRDLRK
jgi:hypothetical protein